MGEVVMGKFKPNIDKLAEELQASVHSLDQLRAAMVRIRADHGSEVLCEVAQCASKGLRRGIFAALDAFDNLQWAIGAEITPYVMTSFRVNSIDRDSFHSEHPPRSRAWMIPDDGS
jgi:hypothetical protein